LALLQEITLQGSERVHLVVSDVVMPHMGGLELYQILRDRFPDIKTLLITGHPLEEDSHAWLEKGSVQWLQKPFSAQEFKQAISRLLDAR
jgi:CheY-like chemotaxis protein